jgi:hypothetical protein
LLKLEDDDLKDCSDFDLPVVSDLFGLLGPLPDLSSRLFLLLLNGMLQKLTLQKGIKGTKNFKY